MRQTPYINWFVCVIMKISSPLHRLGLNFPFAFIGILILVFSPCPSFGIDDFSPLAGIDAEDFGALSEGEITRLSAADAGEWQNVITIIRNGGSDKNYVVTITGNFAIGGVSDYSFGYYSGLTVSLRGSEGERAISFEPGGTIGHLMFVGVKQTLILRNLNLQGTSDNTTALVQVAGTLYIKAGAKITGNTAAINSNGVYISGGNFIMEDGEISNNTANYGGGVNIMGGSFTMTGGEISGNTADINGGGVLVGGGGFTMDGGKISDNSTTNSGGLEEAYLSELSV